MNSPTMRTYKLLIFDLDGTLADSVPDLTTALGLLLTSLQLPPIDEATVRQIIGEGQRSLVERALRRG
ncbi:MAG TPA: HAD hydrolase-like protein, partial [Pseudomonadota bacterium]|nr:HAD hydrolase-like protein [Pseudomonadota bacterium]